MKTMPAAHACATDEIRVMLLPLPERDLLVPASAVAEIISADAVKSRDSMPDWLLGDLLWRGHRVPAITFSPLPKGHFSGRVHARVIVCFMPGEQPHFPFLALYSLGMPRLARSTPEGLEACTAQHPFALGALRLGEHAAWLPDFAAIEQALLDLNNAHATH
ncbi:MAG: chemotaxis protein CheW [Chromatiaceae bacterium]|nr:chemotaxis protein CheW [Chromatiaceae bacterium]